MTNKLNMSEEDNILAEDNKSEFIIANPMYDTAFKSIMYSESGENKENARFLIGTILGVEVVAIQLLPNEQPTKTTIKESKEDAITKKINSQRIDFAATIRNKDGKCKQVHIEVQREQRPTDIMRFRSYLAYQYNSKQTYTEDGVEVEKPLPIISIYFLGFNLDKIKNVVTHVKRTYIDKIGGNEIAQENEYIDALTHDAYFVQVLRIPELTQDGINNMSDLELLMSIFAQKNFEKNKEGKNLEYIKTYSYTINNINIMKILNTLHGVILDYDSRRALEAEYFDSEDTRLWNLKIDNLTSQIAERDGQIAERDGQIAERDSIIARLQQQLIDANRI
jgi:hypothetical protein